MVGSCGTEGGVRLRAFLSRHLQTATTTTTAGATHASAAATAFAATIPTTTSTMLLLLLPLLLPLPLRPLPSYLIASQTGGFQLRAKRLPDDPKAVAEASSVAIREIKNEG